MEVGIVIFPLPALVCADTMNVHPFPPEKISIFIKCKKLHERCLPENPKAGKIHPLTPYNSMGNNPVSMVDPDGDEIITAMLVGAVIGVIGNGISNTANNQGFFENAGMAAVMGAIGGLTSGGSASFGIGMLKSGLGVGSSYLPGVNIPVGDHMSINLSPSLFLGDNGLGIGGNIGWSVNSKNFDFGMSFGATHWSNNPITNNSFWETRVGYGVGIGGRDFKLGFGATDFAGGGIGQQTGQLRAYGEGWSLSYENDWLFPGAALGDSGDRFRTTGVGLQIGSFSTRLNLGTGDPGLKSNDRVSELIDGRKTYVSGTSNKYRLGLLSVGWNGFQIGTNSENVREFFQNRLAHKNGTSSPVFKKLNSKYLPGMSYRTHNPYTTW